MQTASKENALEVCYCDTANALHRTLLGMVDLIKSLLKKGHAYVLPGKISSDRIEAEFGLCRGSACRNYSIGAEVINSVKLHRLRLYSKLEIDVSYEDSDNTYCSFELEDSEEDLDLINSCFEDSSNLSITEKSTLYYICGYITFKEGITCIDSTDQFNLPEEAEFTLNVSRGKLKLPPINLYDYSQYCFSFFKGRKQKCCTKIFLGAFNEIHNLTGYMFENVDSINRRLCNCFFKAFVKSEADKLKIKSKCGKKDGRKTKERRLSSKY